MNTRAQIDTLLRGLLLLLAGPSAAADFADIKGISSLDFGVWQSGGSLSATLSTCVASADTASPNPRGGANNYPYAIKVESLAGSGFTLYRDGNASNSGDQAVAIGLEHRDVLAQTGYEILQPGVYDQHLHDGLFKNCTGSGANSEFRITISQAELAAKDDGVYEGQFRASVLGGESGLATDFEDFVIGLTISGNTSSNSVRISRLNNAAFSPFAGSGDRVWNEHFCVYSGAASGAYRLTVSSLNQDSNGAFRLRNESLMEYLAFSVAFDDSGAGVATTPVGANPVSGLGDPVAENCGGTDNATLTFTVAEQNLSQASSGLYSDTLVLVVEPE